MLSARERAKADFLRNVMRATVARKGHQVQLQKGGRISPAELSAAAAVHNIAVLPVGESAKAATFRLAVIQSA